MARKLEDNPMLRLLQMVPPEGMSVHQISCKTGIDRRTVKRNLQLIMAAQAGPKLRMETVGLRVLVRREK